MNGMVVFTVIDIVLLIAGLAIYLWIVGGQLTRVGTLLEECSELVWDVKRHAEVIDAGLGSINSTGRVIAGALPLLYDMGESIVAGATFDHDAAVERGPAAPASGTRRSRLLESVGYEPD
jgi:hypothetical protein